MDKSLAPGNYKTNSVAMMISMSNIVLMQFTYGRCFDCEIIHTNEFDFNYWVGERILRGWNFAQIWEP